MTTDNDRVGVIIVAAGASERMGFDKVYAGLLGKPMIAHTIAAFEQCPEVHEIVVVLSEENMQQTQVGGKLRTVCQGGARRQDSVKAGLQHITDSCQWVMVHDGDRPCVPQWLIRRGLEAVRATGAAIPALPVTDTIKRVASPPEVDIRGPHHGAGTPYVAPFVLETLQGNLRSVQTPQVFSYALLVEAHQAGLMGPTVTDDAALVEKRGHEVRVFPGSPDNIKITIPQDLERARQIFLDRAGRVGPYLWTRNL